MKSNLDIITASLIAAVLDEDVPSFTSPQFRETVAALKAETQNLHTHEVLGRAAMHLLMVRLQTGMLAEQACSRG